MAYSEFSSCFIAVGTLGNACNSLGDYTHAVEYHQQHLEIARAWRSQKYWDGVQYRPGDRSYPDVFQHPIKVTTNDLFDDLRGITSLLHQNS